MNVMVCCLAVRLFLILIKFIINARNVVRNKLDRVVSIIKALLRSARFFRKIVRITLYYSIQPRILQLLLKKVSAVSIFPSEG